MPTIAPVEFEFYPSMHHAQASRYLIAPFDWQDIERINQHEQVKVLRAAKASIDSSDSPAVAGLVLDAAARVASELSVLSSDTAFAKVEAQAYMLMVVLQKQEQHKHISYGECLDILRDDRNYNEYLIAYQVIKGVLTKKPEAKSDKPNPTAYSQNGHQQVADSVQPQTLQTQ